jgi:PhnB protein
MDAGAHPIMQVEAYLNLAGRCEEALAFYQEALGAEVGVAMRWKESPDPAIKAPPGWEEKIMHAVFRIGETTLMADDGMGPEKTEFKGITLTINVPDDAQARRVFDALGEGGTIGMPLAKTFWTSSFGMLRDRFGVPWMVNVDA